MKKVDYFAKNVLSNNSAVTALVGERIFLSRALQGTTLPYIVYHSGQPIVNNTDTSYSSGEFGRLQVDCIALTATAAAELAEAVRTAFEITYPGVFNGVTVQCALFDNQMSMQYDEAREEGVFGEILDFKVFYNR